VARAQAKKPCAVSRKKISSVRIPTHFVRRRPVKYPPIPEATHWVTINPMAAALPKAAGEGAEKDQGLVIVRPAPVPRAKRMIVTPIAASAPATMARSVESSASAVEWPVWESERRVAKAKSNGPCQNLSSEKMRRNLKPMRKVPKHVSGDFATPDIPFPIK